MKKKNSARETNQGDMEKITGPVRGCFLSLYSESGKDLHAGVMGADGEFLRDTDSLRSAAAILQPELPGLDERRRRRWAV